MLFVFSIYSTYFKLPLIASLNFFVQSINLFKLLFNINVEQQRLLRLRLSQATLTLSLLEILIVFVNTLSSVKTL